MEAYLSELVLKKHSEDRARVGGLVNIPEEVPITITFFWQKHTIDASYEETIPTLRNFKIQNNEINKKEFFLDG